MLKHDGNKIVPVRGKECSTEQLPILGERFSSYEQFAKSSVEEIYTPEALAASYYAEANEFRHGIFYQQKKIILILNIKWDYVIKNLLILKTNYFILFYFILFCISRVIIQHPLNMVF